MSRLVGGLARFRAHARGARLRGDDGVAMLLVLGVTAIITVLTVTVATVSLNNLGNTVRDRQSGSAFATSEAGVAEVVERIRAGILPLSGFTCMESVDPAVALPASCLGTTRSWTSATAPMEVPIDGGVAPCLASQTCYKVWVGTLRAYSPSTGVKTGLYRVHSKGLFGNGPAVGSVVVDLEVRPEAFPIGVFGEKVTGNGGTALYNESLFTRACVSPRNDGSGNGTRFQGTDVFWDQPASAHSTSMISTTGGCGANGDIHKTGTCPNKVAVNNDQAAGGGPVAAPSGCYRTWQRKDGSWYPDASPTAGCTARPDGLCDSTSFRTQDLQRYGYRPRGLSDDQYDALLDRARSTGTYNKSAGSLMSPLNTVLAAGGKQPVIYIDCAEAPSLCPGGSYSLSISDIPAAFKQAPDGPTSFARCASGPQPVLTLVVARGGLVFSGGNANWLDAAIFVPDGKWVGNGGYNVLGTLFTNDLSLGGNETFQLDPCFVRDLPATLLHIESVKFSQDDSRDLN